MEFNLFENKNNPHEYLHIYVYSKLYLNGTANIIIDDYIEFEITDTLVASFNSWVKTLSFSTNLVEGWFLSNQNKVDYFTNNFPLKFKPKVVIWSDRNKTSYYKEKLQDSFMFENHIAELIAVNYDIDLGQYMDQKGQYELGENALGIEIKNDTLISKYNNIYIEYQEKSKASNYNFVNSGILKKDNCIYFLIGTFDKFYIFKKTVLAKIYEEEIINKLKNNTSTRSILFKEQKTSKGFVFPVRKAIEYTITMDEMIEEIKKNELQ